jgi:hypothetical protein
VAIFGLKISDFRLLTVGNLPLFLWKKLNLEGQYLEDKSVYSSGGNASCSVRDRGSSGVLGFVRLAPHCAQDDKQNEEPKDDKQSEEPRDDTQK